MIRLALVIAFALLYALLTSGSVYRAPRAGCSSPRAGDTLSNPGVPKPMRYW